MPILSMRYIAPGATYCVGKEGENCTMKASFFSARRLRPAYFLRRRIVCFKLGEHVLNSLSRLGNSGFAKGLSEIVDYANTIWPKLEQKMRLSLYFQGLDRNLTIKTKNGIYPGSSKGGRQIRRETTAETGTA